MSSAGHTQDMTARLKQNRAALTSKKAKFRQKKFTVSASRGNTDPIHEKELTREELEKIKQEIREEIRRETILKWIKVSIVAGVTIFLFLSLVSFLYKL